MTTISDLLQGIIVETKTKSFTGGFLYSDQAHGSYKNMNWYGEIHTQERSQPVLNSLARIPVIGIAAGVARMALAVIHSVGHLFAALVTSDKRGHCFHAAKGGCEFLRGLIEAIPIAGRIFANFYYDEGDWWILKIYNPADPDSLDDFADRWQHLREVRPNGYVIA